MRCAKPCMFSSGTNDALLPAPEVDKGLGEGINDFKDRTRATPFPRALWAPHAVELRRLLMRETGCSGAFFGTFVPAGPRTEFDGSY